MGTGLQSGLAGQQRSGGEDYFAILTILKTAIRDHSLGTFAKSLGPAQLNYDQTDGEYQRQKHDSEPENGATFALTSF